MPAARVAERLPVRPGIPVGGPGAADAARPSRAARPVGARFGNRRAAGRNRAQLRDRDLGGSGAALRPRARRGRPLRRRLWAELRRRAGVGLRLGGAGGWRRRFGGAPDAGWDGLRGRRGPQCGNRGSARLRSGPAFSRSGRGGRWAGCAGRRALRRRDAGVPGQLAAGFAPPRTPRTQQVGDLVIDDAELILRLEAASRSEECRSGLSKKSRALSRARKSVLYRLPVVLMCCARLIVARCRETSTMLSLRTLRSRPHELSAHRH